MEKPPQTTALFNISQKINIGNTQNGVVSFLNHRMSRNLWLRDTYHVGTPSLGYSETGLQGTPLYITDQVFLHHRCPLHHRFLNMRQIIGHRSEKKIPGSQSVLSSECPLMTGCTTGFTVSDHQGPIPVRTHSGACFIMNFTSLSPALAWPNLA